jgi:CBS domain containing-hemolysin-like protein
MDLKTEGCCCVDQVGIATVALTVFTLVFGELIPKSLGVSNAELVARTMVRPLIATSVLSLSTRRNKESVDST